MKNFILISNLITRIIPFPPCVPNKLYVRKKYTESTTNNNQTQIQQTYACGMLYEHKS